MRHFLVTPIAVSLLSTPAQGALSDPAAEQLRIGAFAGVHLQIPMGKRSERRSAHFGLTLAPTATRISPEGFARSRIGEGVALDFAERSGAQLKIGGLPAKAALGLNPVNTTRVENRNGISTAGWIGIGVGVGAVLAVGGLLLWADHISDCEERDDDC